MPHPIGITLKTDEKQHKGRERETDVFGAPHPSVHLSVRHACVAQLKTNPPLKPFSVGGSDGRTPVASHVTLRVKRERVHLHPKGVDWMLPHHCTACRKRKREEEATAALSLTDRGSDLARQRQRCRPRCCCLTLGMDGAEGRSERSARARKASVGGALFRSRIIKKRKPHGLARLICLAMTDNGWICWDCNKHRLHLFAHQVFPVKPTDRGDVGFAT